LWKTIFAAFFDQIIVSRFIKNSFQIDFPDRHFDFSTHLQVFILKIG